MAKERILMKKALVGLLFLLLLVASLTACKDDRAEATSEPEPPAKVEQPPSETKVVTKKEEDDPLWIYDDGYTENHGIFLLRDGKRYHMTHLVLAQPEKDYLPGSFSRMSEKNDGNIRLYAYDSTFGNKSVGEVPIPVLRPGDRIVHYTDGSSLNLYFAPVIVKGYSCLIFSGNENPKGGPDDLCCLWDLQTDKEICEVPLHVLKDEGTEFRSEDGEVVDYSQFYDSLEKDKRYTVSWWEGTNYYEYEFVADCLSFYIDEVNEVAFEGQLNKEEKCADYDMEAILSLPSGIYRMSGGVLIEIP